MLNIHECTKDMNVLQKSEIFRNNGSARCSRDQEICLVPTTSIDSRPRLTPEKMA